ncbi:MAG: GNAT family N-acetyltransferase [Melioribacteraceae bacterium]
MEPSLKNTDKYFFYTENKTHIYIRNATIEDAKLIFDLSNESIVRENSINQNKILWEDHLRWLPGKLADDSCFYLLTFSAENLFIGQIRFDICETEAIVGISITKEFRGKGLSTDLLKHSAELLFANYQHVGFVTAKINKSNEASVITFTKAGYIYYNKESINNNDFLVFKLVRENGT